MGFNTFGPLLVVDAQLTPAAGVVGTVVDATTMEPVTTYSMSGTPMSLVTNARGYVGQFQAPDTSVMLRLMFGDLALDVVAKEVIAAGGGGTGGVTSVDGKTGAVSLSSTYVARRSAYSLGILTDSISAFDQAGLSYKVTRNWHGILSINSLQRVRRAGVYGTGGATMANIRDTHLPALLAGETETPSHVAICAGTNDLSTEATMEAAYAVLITVAETLESNGITPVLWLVPPRADALLANVGAWNARVGRLAFLRGYPVVDAYTPLADPATGGWAVAGDHSDDVHPTGDGHGKIAEALLANDRFLHMFAPSSPYLSGAAIDDANLTTYGHFVADSNADGLADGWSIWGGTSFTASIITEDGYQWQRLAKTAGQAGQGGIQLNITTGFSPGDRVAFSGLIRCSTSEGVPFISVDARAAGVTIAQPIIPLYNAGTSGIPMDGMVYGEATVPATTDTLRLNVQWFNYTPVDAVHFQTARLTIVNLTTLGVA